MGKLREGGFSLSFFRSFNFLNSCYKIPLHLFSFLFFFQFSPWLIPYSLFLLYLPSSLFSFFFINILTWVLHKMKYHKSSSYPIPLLNIY
jgi:hypothetical protein